ncbi:MAG: hypothetical protein IT530_21745 [Burkholderiales bacterium]|nr:hypothetical protein [Burkholderiales bacterium]
MSASIAGARPTRRIAVLGSDRSCAAGAPPHLIGLAPPGIELVTWPLPLPGFPHTPYDRVLVEVSHAAAAAEAVASGVDAIYVDTFGDYALAAMRSLGDVPVIGAGEATLHAATLVARRFSIVTVWPRSMRFIYEDRLLATGLGARCLSIRHLGEAPSVMDRLERADADVTARIVAACHEAVAQDGAEAIALGCSCMAPVHTAVAAAVDVPVLCCSRTGLAMAVAAVLGRWSSSPVAYPRVPAGRAARLVTLAHGAQTTDGEEACPVCPATPKE